MSRKKGISSSSTTSAYAPVPIGVQFSKQMLQSTSSGITQQRTHIHILETIREHGEIESDEKQPVVDYWFSACDDDQLP